MMAKKTIIIFDTNQFHSGNGEKLSYGYDEMGWPFEQVGSLVKSHGLTQYIDLAIPRIALTELIHHKRDSYIKDADNIKGIIDRLSHLPNTDFSNILLPDPEFNYMDYVKPEIERFVSQNGFKIIDLGEEKLSEVLKEIIIRVFEKRRPFKVNGDKHTDSGFKDVMIWESILNYEYNAYDQILFVSADRGFEESCIEEFESKVKKHMKILRSVDEVQKQVELDYELIVKNKVWIDYVSKVFFKDHINREISTLKEIELDGVKYSILNVVIKDLLNSVNDFESDENDDEKISYTVLTSLLNATAKTPDGLKNVTIRALTYLDESKGIDSTDFEGEFSSV